LALFWTFGCLGKRVESGISIRVCVLYFKKLKSFTFINKDKDKESEVVIVDAGAGKKRFNLNYGFEMLKNKG